MPASIARSPRPAGVLALAALLVATAGCTTGERPGAEAVGSSAPVIEAPSPTATPPRTTEPAPTERPTPSGDRGPGPDGVTITAPPPGVEADGPVVVLVHGGAWVAGSPDLLDNLADALAADGAVVFNASYRLARQPGGGDPGSLDDVACAIRFARAEAPAYTDAEELVLVGHSAGAHLAAVVALDPAPWGGDCAYPPAGPPDRFVGLAGIYDVKVVPLVYFFAPFVGAWTTEAPERWAAVNPVDLAVRQNLDVRLVTASEDELVPPSQAQAFADALPDGAEMVEITGADHNDLQYPSIVGLDTILEK